MRKGSKLNSRKWKILPGRAVLLYRFLPNGDFQIEGRVGGPSVMREALEALLLLFENEHLFLSQKIRMENAKNSSSENQAPLFVGEEENYMLERLNRLEGIIPEISGQDNFNKFPGERSRLRSIHRSSTGLERKNTDRDLNSNIA